MNRALFITIGIVIIILVFMVWLWLFFNGAPANTREVFSDLGIVEPTERPADTIDAQNPDRVVLNLTDGTLQQVTTGAVAGYVVASSTKEQGVLRYVERGTGYVFDVNLNSGLKTQVTPSAMPNTVAAYFSPNAEQVVMVSERDGRSVTLLTLPETATAQAEAVTLSNDAENIQFLDDTTLTYTRNSHVQTIGYTYDLTTNTATERFSLSLPDATVITTERGNIFAYPKPSASFPGALYEVQNGTLAPYSELAPGLVPFISGGMGFINTISENNTYQTKSLPNLLTQQILMMPEKCVASSETQQIWCGSPSQVVPSSYVEDWYKGIMNSDDIIWVANHNDGTAQVLINPKQATGRQLDITNMTLGPDSGRLFFQNKIDATLWLLNLSL